MKWIDRISAIAGALILSQMPHFMMQYQHRLAGHVAELRYQVFLLSDAAQRSGKSLTAFIQKFISSSDPDFSSQGLLMRAMMERMENLGYVQASLEGSSSLARPFVFAGSVDIDIALSTFNSYHLGISLTAETAAYAASGLVIGCYASWVVRKLFSLVKAMLFFFGLKNPGRS